MKKDEKIPTEKTAETPAEPVEKPVENSEGSADASSAITSLKAEISDLTANLQRTRADFENFRKQTEAQREKSMTLARQSTVLKLLPLLDDLDRAISVYSDQLSPLKKTFEKSLRDLKIAKIPADETTEFNPDLHEAVMMADDEEGKEVISEVLRPGYTYDGEVIRPAMVKVKHVL